MQRVKLIDSPMGTGKTSYIIDYINKLDDEIKVIYITPFIEETERIKANCKRHFILPSVKEGDGAKSRHFLELIRNGENIASTHALFSNISNEMIEAIQRSDYILILDEAFEVITKFDIWRNDRDFYFYDQEQKDNLTKQTVRSLVAKKCIEIDEEYRVHWIDNEYYQPKYNQIKTLADRGLLYLVSGELLLWSFPAEVFQPGVFQEIYILTYLFDHQIQFYYFTHFCIEYDNYHIEKINDVYTLVKTENKEYENEWIESIKPLINIVAGSLNKKGIFFDKRNKVQKTALSKTWYMKSARGEQYKIKELKKAVATFFMNYTDATGEEKMWTCFKAEKGLFKSPNISRKNWVAFNARAVNKYGNKKAIAYCVNRYLDPFFIHFFAKKKIYLSHDKFALSEMLQFIFRSAIRNGQPITIYIPSERMRNLLYDYLNRKEIEDTENDLNDINEFETEVEFSED